MKPMFKMSDDARLLYGRLKDAKIDETISYEELARVAGRPIEKIRGALYTAQRRCQVDNHILFGVVRKVGLVRLSDTEIVAESVKTTAGVRRKARRGAARLFSINDFNGMSERDKAQHMARASILSSVAHLTQERQIDKFIEASKDRVKPELPVSETLKMFT